MSKTIARGELAVAADLAEMENERNFFKTRCGELEATLIEEASQLEKWGNESREGGWSTHQVDPMRKRADVLRRIATTKGIYHGQ